MDIRIGVLGLGYVGLPLALAFARTFKGTVGFDIASDKVAQLRKGIDVTEEGLDDEIKATSLKISDSIDALKGCNFYVVTVPTPVDQNHNPDLTPLRSACEVLAKVISKGATIVFESTVYPGLTEEICGTWIAELSGLARGRDFKLGYSPERMNPGDKEHSVDKIVKVVAGEDAATLELVSKVYGTVVTAGLHRASSIKVAEAAKVIENTQRDLNIALMNELAIIFDKIGIATRDVLEAAGTKWNFLRFSPGLVGGHCIGVDPYYLTTKAEQLGYHPQVILAGRRINDGMGAWLAQRMVKLMVNAGFALKGARVGVLGLTFKENVSDIRNSRVPDIVKEMREFGAEVLVHDPLAKGQHVKHEYGLELSGLDAFKDLDGVILAVAHAQYREMALSQYAEMLKKNAILMDVKAILDRSKVPSGISYWCL
jgi:UDP-N-acetyl-D-galactosamine dehydrogenase